MKFAAEKRYSFRVTVVTDGDRSGLLVERKKAGDAKPVYGYFWLKEPEGFTSTAAIREKCGENCQGLECAKDYKDKPKKYARFYTQERIFREILAYAKAAGESGNMKAQRSLTQDYTDDKKGYPQILHRFFYADPPYELAELLDGLDIFTSYVLRKPEGKDCLVGMAEEFAVRSPNSLFPEENFDLLFTVEEVLETEHPPPAEWFRKGGPVISDFTDKRVHRRKVVDKLKKEVLSNPVYLLEGDAATGKTVIVRSLIYDLYQEGPSDVYYFDIGPRRYFSETQLVREIRTIKGIVIIENIHLEPHKVQLIYQKIKHDPDRHILFTARPPYREFQDKFSSEDLIQIEKHTLKPFEEVKDLIQLFCSHPETPELVKEKLDEVLEIAQDDYWLLAFALQGCANNKGKGKPEIWISDEVKKYLRNLETCEDPYDDQYPEILLALSPLYKYEVCTAKDYLTKKSGFTVAALNDLTKRGEIVRQKGADDNILFGLPHSSLADAYWEHGKEYITQRELRVYEEFIYDYVRSDVPNGLEVIYWIDTEGEDSIHARLNNTGELVGVIEREQSMMMLSLWAGSLVDYRRTCDHLKSKRLKSILAKIIMMTEDLNFAGVFFRKIYWADNDTGRQLWQLLDPSRLANKLSTHNDVWGAGLCIDRIQSANEDMAFELCELLNVEELACRLRHAETVQQICNCLLYVFSANKDKGIKLWQLLDKKELLAKLGQIRDLSKTAINIACLVGVPQRLGWGVWKQVNRQLADRLSRTKDVSRVADCISVIDGGNSEAARELCGLLDIHKLAHRLNKTKNIHSSVRCISLICNANGKTGAELCELLDSQELADRLNQLKDICEVAHCTSSINMVKPKFGVEINRLLNIGRIANELNHTQDMDLMRVCLVWFSKGNRETFQKLRRLLDLKKLATNLMQAGEIFYITDCIIRRIWENTPEIGQELLRLIDIRKLANMFNTDVVQYFNTCIFECVSAIYTVNPDACLRFCEYLDIHKLVFILKKIKNVDAQSISISTIIKANKNVGRELCKLLDEE